MTETKALLADYAANKALLALYQAELEGGVQAFDTVRGSMHGHPYVERVIKVTGTDAHRTDWLHERILALSTACTQAESFVSSVRDETTRALLHWHYLKGFSWPKVRRVMGLRDKTTDALRMRAERFLREFTPAPDR